ncbi:MAG: hypothetical protein QNJ97_22990 [Myxococcota bacterium]|nr:hypothetical protein [Myxococcota bacterium]
MISAKQCYIVRRIGVLILLFFLLCCEPTNSPNTESGDLDPGEDSDGSTDSDSDGDTDADTDGDNDSDGDTDSPAEEYSYLWIANTGEGTLTKIATRDEVEVARYTTCPYDVKCDPSRTSVNLYGDMVVTGRRQEVGSSIWWGEGASMVTKFAAYEEDCIDKNNNGVIDTSTGPTDVKPWGEDECMVWSTELAGNIGARGTAWDGKSDIGTGIGGHVWVGTCDRDIDGNETEIVYVINGDTGEIDDELEITGYCLYGAASDGESVWFIDLIYPTLTDGPSDEHFRLTQINIETKEVQAYQTPCSYGITVDADGLVWTGGYNPDMWGEHCIARFNPYASEGNQVTRVDIPVPNMVEANSWGVWMRGLGVGIELSEGYVWAVQTVGLLHKIDLSTLSIVDSFDIETNAFVEQQNHIIGVAIDFDGYVWVVSEIENAAYKVHPQTGAFKKIIIGEKPYTYSDMTGIQLHNAIVVI